MNVTAEVAEILRKTFTMAADRHYEYATPELLLLVMCKNRTFRNAYVDCGGDVAALSQDLEGYLEENVEKKDTPPSVQTELSAGLGAVLSMAGNSCMGSGKSVVELSHIVHALFSLKDSYAVFYMEQQEVEEVDLLQTLTGDFDEAPDDDETDDCYDSEPGDGYPEPDEEDESDTLTTVKSIAPCLNDTLGDVNPLIGREDELARTIQILCRKDKNNPLHIGEPGVGKTAITYGLVRMIVEDRVPEPLRGAKVYALDLGSTIAGTKYRGEFEKRLKRVMEKVSHDEKPIVYIDEIHNLMGAGATGEGSFDAANILKPYLAEGHIRFIGATTFDEYKKYFEKNRSIVRRFQNVEIKEPSEEETVKILEGLKSKYEKFHGVSYGKGVLEYAVAMSAKYINERYLPDKAIDLIDEAGAYRKLHPLEQKRQTVGKDVIDETLTKICRVPKQSVETDELSGLKTLEKRILAQIYGQDRAVMQVVNAVKFSRAGLIEDAKPLASLLFVGPTGVGKTEIAKTLAAELGVKLIRFDMSEYAEKHTVAKLIGSPAGYVGYEEGGLLTEAIRKNPSCVLLLDEIEKAHNDIYSILLQVMDYATLTDNQGRKADFRNVVIIMTSNAGATRLGKSGMGFLAHDMSNETLMDEVKKVFQPEFRNRLNGIVVFNPIDDRMAELIAAKKLRDLGTLLKERKVELSWSDEAIGLLKSKGTSREYGAREIDRIVRSEIKPLLVDELLFGKLKKGGSCRLEAKDGAFTVKLR